MGHAVLKTPEKHVIERLYRDIRQWEEVCDKSCSHSTWVTPSLKNQRLDRDIHRFTRFEGLVVSS